MKLPPPEATLAGCVFLPRIIAKARAYTAGLLPEEYSVRFGVPDGVDGLFLGFFTLSRDQIVEASVMSDASIAQWFESVASRERIEAWNHTALNLGRPGFPLAERLPITATSKYKHLANRRIETIFQMLNADEEAPSA
jgi:hypothetical protein